MCYHLRLGDVAVTIAIAVAAGTRPHHPSRRSLCPLQLVLSARVCGSSMCPCGSIISSFIDPIYVTGETILRYASPRVAFTLSLCTRCGPEGGVGVEGAAAI